MHSTRWHIWVLGSMLLLTLLSAACTPLHAQSSTVHSLQAAQESSQQKDSGQQEESKGTEMWYEVDDLKMYYEVHGEGQPVLLLHGSPSDHNMTASAFEPIFREREGYQRIYVDLPGMGQTTGGSWLAGNDDVVALLVQFVEEIFSDKQFILIGMSYGGYLARGLLHEKSAQIDGLFLVAPSVADHPEARILAPHLTVVSNPEGLAQFPAPFDEFFGSTLVVQNESVLAQVGVIVDGVLAADQETLARIRQRHAFSFAADVLPEPFVKPVLILTGKHDSIVGYEEAGDLLQYYPRATYAVLDRAGHGVNMEQPALFHALAHEWLDRVEEEQANSLATEAKAD